MVFISWKYCNRRHAIHHLGQILTYYCVWLLCREVAGYDEDEAGVAGGRKRGGGGKLLGGIRGFGAALGRSVASAASKGGILLSEVMPSYEA